LLTMVQEILQIDRVGVGGSLRSLKAYDNSSGSLATFTNAL